MSRNDGPSYRPRCRQTFQYRSLTGSDVRFWPKADTRERIVDPKFGYQAFFGLLSVRFRPKADTRMISLNPLLGSVI